MRLNIIMGHNVPTSSWSLQKVGTEEDRIDSLTYIKKISHWDNLLWSFLDERWVLGDTHLALS